MVRRVAVLAFLVVAVSGCTRSHEAAAPVFRGAPVVLISIDTLRADHLPLYGYQGVATPAIDALARDGVTFDSAFSSCPMTLPSHVTMLTGLLPPEHGVRDNVGFAFDAKREPTLPSLLHEKGYATGAAVSSWVLRGETGLAAAFDTYDDAIDPRPGAAFREYQRPDAQTEAAAERWIAQNGAKPFFYFLHLYDPHAPYEPPEPFRTEYRDHPYDGEIAESDAVVGRFMEFLKQKGIYDRAIIILTSDHGEGLGDHGEEQHSILLYRELIRVPMVVKLPRGERKGTRVPAAVAVADITPTALALVGVDARPAPHSQSMFDAIPADRTVYSESYYARIHFGWSELRSLAGNRFHLMRAQSGSELYDQRADPAEKTNIVASERRQTASLASALGDLGAQAPSPNPVDAETGKKLESLGYLGSRAQSEAHGVLPNPRDRIGDIAKIRVALGLAASGHDHEAAEVLGALVRDNPQMNEAWVQLAQLYQQQQKPDAAIRAWREALARSQGLPDEIGFGLAEAYLMKGQPDEATKWVEPVRARSPRRAEVVLARIALERGDLDTAERLSQTVASSPQPVPSDLVLVAGIRLRRRDYAGATQYLDRAQSLAGESRVYKLQYLRGEILAQTNHPQEALAAFSREIADFPTDTTAYTHAAVLHFLLGDKPGADALLDAMVRANPSPQACLLAASTLESLEDLEGARRWRERATTMGKS
jgi:choline-sulfatase